APFVSGGVTLLEVGDLMLDRLLAQGDVVGLGKYDYAITASDPHGANVAALNGVPVLVPQSKQRALAAFWQAAIWAAGINGVGAPLIFDPGTTPEGLAMLGLG